MTQTQWTDAMAEQLSDFLETHDLGVGLGMPEQPCSIAAVQMVLSGLRTDILPTCMSEVAGIYVRIIQDSVPDSVRNSTDWYDALIDIAGSGRDPDAENVRLGLLLDWLYEDVLPLVQARADAGGYGLAWDELCAHRTSDAARRAEKAIAIAGAPDSMHPAEIVQAVHNLILDSDSYAHLGRRTGGHDPSAAANHREWQAYQASLVATHVVYDAADWYETANPGEYSPSAEDEFWRDRDPARLLARMAAVRQ